MPSPERYPVFLNLEEKACLVVGGGVVGEHKAFVLIDSGAVVTVVSPAVTERLRTEERVNWKERQFEVGDLEDKVLVVAATDSDQVNAQIVDASRARGIWVNDAMSAERSDFILPATVKRGGLTLAVSTQGGSPAYAKLVRQMLESEFGEEHAEMVSLLAELRPRVKATLLSSKDRRDFWDRVVTEDTLRLIKSGKMNVVAERIEQWLS
jgi:precorrin-2 dehydrogenase/sirohydrochlorin ferrochelatase